MQEGLKRGILPIFRIDLDDAMIAILFFLDLDVLIDLKLTFQLIPSDEVILYAV